MRGGAAGRLLDAVGPKGLVLDVDNEVVVRILQLKVDVIVQGEEVVPFRSADVEFAGPVVLVRQALYEAADWEGREEGGGEGGWEEGRQQQEGGCEEGELHVGM